MKKDPTTNPRKNPQSVFGSAGPPTIGYQMFADDALSMPVYADDAKTKAVSAADIGYAPQPPANTDDITLAVNGNVTFWDGKIYDGTQTWANQVAVPTDGSAQTDADAFLGATGSAAGDDPSYSLNKWNLGGAQFFKAKNANIAEIASMHKTVAGTAWTFWAKVKTPSTVPTLNALFGTASVVGDVGMVIRGDSSGKLKLDFYDGVGLHTKQHNIILASNTVYNVAVAYDAVSDIVYLSLNGAPWQTQHPSGFTAAVNGASTWPFCIAAQGNGVHKMPNGAVMYGCGILDHVLSPFELTNLFAFVDQHYVVNVIPGAPAQTYSVAAMADNAKINLAWAKPNDFGIVITDYLVEYKLASSSVWSTFAHVASAQTFITITGLANNSAYNFRISAINSQGTGPPSNIASATPVVPGTPPYNIDLFYLTVPVDVNGNRSGVALTVTAPTLDTYTSAWFGRADGQFIFNVPDGAAGTNPTDPFARSEFRNLANIDNGAVGYSDTIKFQVKAIKDKTKIVVHQLHATNNAAYKCSFTGSSSGLGTLRAIIQIQQGGPYIVYSLLTGVTTGDIITMRVKRQATTLEFYFGANVNGGVPDVVVPFDRTGLTDTLYFKRGAYYDDAAKLGDLAQVIHFTQTGVYGS